MPVVNVSFSMYGQSARVIEAEVTSKLEGMLSRIKGVQSVNSFSRSESGSISVRLNEHVDPDMVRFEISTIVRQAWASLPAGVSYPGIYMSGSGEEAAGPFIRYTVNAPYSPIVIRDYVENVIKPKLSDVKGIEDINVSGATRMIWKIEYDYERLKNYNLSVGDIRSAIQAGLGREFLGLAQIDETSDECIRLALVHEDGNKNFDPSLVQVVKDGTFISLDQLVSCSFQEEEATSYFRINGLNSIYLSFTAKDWANRLQLSNEVQAFFETIKEDLPEGYELHLSYNEGEYISAELNKIYFRTGLTVLILLCFILLVYRNLKYSLLIILSLICNIAVAVIFYYLFGLEMQLFSLAGLTISLNLIIDNAIIMSDQIIRRGNRKAFLAILSATVTTMGSLVIIFFMNEKVRLNLQDFAGVIIINLTISLLVAILLVPALIEKMGITGSRKQSGGRGLLKMQLFRKIRGKRFAVYFNRFYEKMMRLLYRWKGCVAACIILLFGLPVFLLPEKMEYKKTASHGFSYKAPDTTFVGKVYNNTLGSAVYKEKIKPVTDVALGGTMRLFAQKVRNGSYSSGERSETTLNVTASLPNGSTRDQMNTLVQKMENYIRQYSEVRQFETDISSGRRASIRILFVKEHQRGSFPYMLRSKLISKAIELGGGSWGVYGLGDGFSNDLKEQAGQSRIKLLGYNYDELNILAEAIRDSLMENRRIKDIVINSEFSWFKDDYTEFVFELDKGKLSVQQISPAALYNSFIPMFRTKDYVGSRIGRDGYEALYLFSKQVNKLDIWNMENYPGVAGDRDYKLSELASIEKLQAPKDIAKEDQQYRLCLQYDYIGSYMQSEKILKRQIESFNETAPLGFKAENEYSNYWWGADGNMSQYWLLFLIIAIVYAASGILFNSLRQPLIIVFIIPISFIGIFLTFYWFNLNFDQGGFAAFILLSGLAVNANIYILNEYNNIRKRHPAITPMKAYLKAWNAKIKPIFLTVFSTVLGFIPFMVGQYREAFWFPLAAGTTGGLLFSLIALFCFLPLLMGVGKRTAFPKQRPLQ
ncbi:multidrug efflux pump protein [Bacteroidia bacterium]|nr:multidrug efflux pump protein [Bacteroidia bacterium]